MIRYSRIKLNYYPHYTDIEEFIQHIQVTLETDQTCEVELQPGDATRYHWLIRQGMDIYDLTKDRQFALGHTRDPWESPIELNKCTLCLMMDVINRVNDRFERWYDYEAARPIGEES